MYGIKPHREMMNSNTEESTQNQSQKENDQEATENDEESPRKRQKLIENRTKYNTDMINQTKRKQQNKQPKFKISDMVSVKIDEVVKTNPLHPKMLLGKIISVEDTGCVHIVTEYGKMNTLISISHLIPCTATNVHLDYSREISFSAACKKASGFS